MAFKMEAFVFDLDDTLYPEREYVVSGFRTVAREFAIRLGDPALTLERMIRLFDSKHRPRVFHALLDELSLEDPTLATAMIETYRAHRPALALFDDADRVLGDLGGRFHLGILTDGRPTAQRAKIEALALRTRVDEIVVSSELAPMICKPDPRPFEFISTRLQVRWNRIAYVGDNAAKDFLAPNRMGWRTVQVRRPGGFYRDAPPPPGGAPAVILADLKDLPGELTGCS